MKKPGIRAGLVQVTLRSGNTLVLLHQAIRAVVRYTLIAMRQVVAVFFGSNPLILIDQTVRAVLSQGRQANLLSRFHFAEYRLFAGGHRKRSRGEKRSEEHTSELQSLR